ncbi:hypothetical protein AMECASPLE_005263 [Ameca splendens]|uniref:Uncharacterized protein n=1 Tax=Ameca splendens TaxID=208324 RepID=A0ABV0YAT9_9TELE
MPLAQLADPWQKMPVGGTAGEDAHHDPEDTTGDDDSMPACTLSLEVVDLMSSLTSQRRFARSAHCNL